MALQKGINSFVTVQEADDYFNDRLYSETWFNSSELVEQALVTATGILDNLNWGGTAEPTASYPLSWPRDITYYNPKIGDYEGLDDDRSESNYGTIPEDIKKATYELALHLISNMQTAVTNASGANKVTDLTVGSIRLAFDIASGIDNYKELPDSILNIVSKYFDEQFVSNSRGVKVSGGA